MMIAEHKLNLIHQLDELPEELVFELETIISRLKENSLSQKKGLKALLASWKPLEEEFPKIEDHPPKIEDIF